MIPDYPGAFATTLVNIRALLDYPPFPDPWLPGGRLDGHLWALRRHWAKQRTASDAAAAVRAEAVRLSGRDEEALKAWQAVFANEFPVV